MDFAGFQTYKDLEIYKIAHSVAVDLHHFSLKLPKFELFETGSQLRRSSKSISANIVEGFGRRRYKGEFIRFLTYGHASCNETIEWIEYVRDCHPNFADPSNTYLLDLDQLGRRMNRFISSVERGHR